MSPKLLREWELYAQMEPFGGYGEDMRLRQQLSWQAAFAGMRQHGQPLPLESFTSPWSPSVPKKKQKRSEIVRAQQELLFRFTGKSRDEILHEQQK